MTKQSRGRRQPISYAGSRVPATAPAGRQEAGLDLAFAVTLAAATFLLYLPILSNGFVEYDDPQYVTGNAVVQRGLSAETVRWAFTTTHFANWLPVTWLSHLADVSMFGWKDAGGHHATSAVLHAVNAALVFLVLRSMTGARWRSAAVAALFAVHPLRVESVAWVAERKDVLSATFFLLTLLAWSRSVRRRCWGWYAGAAALYALGLMAKTMLVTLPCVLLLLDVWPLRRVRWGPKRETDEAASRATSTDPPTSAAAATPGRLLLEKVPLFVLALVASGWTMVLQRQGHALYGQEIWSPGQRLANAVVSVPRYLGKLFWPADLSVFYPHPGTWPASAVIGSAALIVAMTVGAWIELRRRPYLIVGWLWFLGMLVPVSGVVQAGLQAMADRYTYLSSIGLTLAIVWAAAELLRRSSAPPAVAPAAATLAVIALSAVTHTQEAYWHDTKTLFQHALDVDERNYLAHDMIGQQLSAAKKESAATEHYRRAIELNPTFTYGYVHLGASLVHTRHPAQALETFAEAVRRNPESATAHLWLGIGLSSVAKRYPEADAEFAEAARLDPSSAETYIDWAQSQENRGRPDAALPLYQMAMKLDPTDKRAKAGLDRLAKARPAVPMTLPAAGAP